MFPGQVLQPEPALEQEQPAIEIEGLGFRLGCGDRLPPFRPMGEMRRRKEPRGQSLLLRRRPRPRRREADQPLDEPEEKREIKIEALALGRAGEPVDEAVKLRALDLRQAAE